MQVSDTILRYICASLHLDATSILQEGSLSNLASRIERMPQNEANAFGLWVGDADADTHVSLITLPCFGEDGDQFMPPLLRAAGGTFYTFLDFLQLVSASTPPCAFVLAESTLLSDEHLAEASRRYSDPENQLLPEQTPDDRALLLKWETEPTSPGFVQNPRGLKDSTIALMSAALLSRAARQGAHQHHIDTSSTPTPSATQTQLPKFSHSIPASMSMISLVIYSKLEISFRGDASTNNRSGNFTAAFWGVSVGIGHTVGDMLFSNVSDLNSHETRASFEWRALFHYVESENVSGGGNRMEFRSFGSAPASLIWGSGSFTLH